jgi:N utilization substance protein B
MSADQALARRAARLAGVQALYQMEHSGASTADVFADFDAGRLPRESDVESDLLVQVEGDRELFHALIENAVARQSVIDQTIARHLSEGWRLERIDAVARAILRAGATELESRADIDTPVVINEYVEIAKSFFDGPEPGFINAALDACAKDLRVAGGG